MTSEANPARAAGDRRRPTVGGMLTRAFAVLISLIAVLGLIRTAVTEPMYRAADQQRSQLLALRDANSQLRSSLVRAQLGLDGYLLTGDQSFVRNYQAA